MSAWNRIQVSLAEFAPGVEFTFQRLAVNPEQIEEYALPTRPTKKTDARAVNFAGETVEVDAMPSNALRSIVREAIEVWIDPAALALTRTVEEQERSALQALATNGVL